MGMFLNSANPYKKYRTMIRDPYFVDKTELLESLIPALGKEQRYLCITRPRRFGKTVMANMVAAYFGSAAQEDPLFEDLKISKSAQYRSHLHRHNVIFMDLSRVPEMCRSYVEYISRIRDGLKRDILERYGDINLCAEDALWDILDAVCSKTGDKFIFVLDEWDAIFHMSFASEDDKKAYLLFLKSLLKDQEYVELAYMTGVLPIAKYSSGSELNMFLEYDMATKERFSEAFGFSEEEVDMLYSRYVKTTDSVKVTREDLRTWYDGYYTAAGGRLYHPCSVVCAMIDNQVSDYWISPGSGCVPDLRAESRSVPRGGDQAD